MLESVGYFADNLGFVCKFRRLCRDMRRDGSVFLQKKLVSKSEAACHANIRGKPLLYVVYYCSPSK